MEYKVLVALTISDLEQLVNTYLAKQWMLVGGIQHSGDYFRQAVQRNTALYERMAREAKIAFTDDNK